MLVVSHTFSGHKNRAKFLTTSAAVGGDCRVIFYSTWTWETIGDELPLKIKKQPQKTPLKLENKLLLVSYPEWSLLGVYVNIFPLQVSSSTFKCAMRRHTPHSWMVSWIICHAGGREALSVLMGRLKTISVLVVVTQILPLPCHRVPGAPGELKLQQILCCVLLSRAWYEHIGVREDHWRWVNRDLILSPLWNKNSQLLGFYCQEWRPSPWREALWIPLEIPIPFGGGSTQTPGLTRQEGPQ